MNFFARDLQSIERAFCPRSVLDIVCHLHCLCFYFRYIALSWERIQEIIQYQYIRLKMRHTIQSIDTALAAREPDEPENIFDLTSLPDPPDDWTFLGDSCDTVQNRNFGSDSSLKSITKLQFWGIRYHNGEEQTPAFLKKSLWKLFYYQREICRPYYFSDMSDEMRDTGPRLLRYTLNPCPDPVSRFYPTVPPALPTLEGRKPGFKRPHDVPQHLPDSSVDQFLFSVWKPGVTSVAVDRDIDKGDGTWLYIKSPVDLFNPEQVTMKSVCQGIAALGLVDESDIETAQLHSQGGWIARLKSREMAWNLRSSRLEICGFPTHATIFKPEGARIFFCSDYGRMSQYELVRALLEADHIRKAGIPFWVGVQKTGFSAGQNYRCLLVFESPLCFSDFELPIGVRGPQHMAQFEGGRESDRQSMKKLLTDQCVICGQDHSDRPVQHCPLLETVLYEERWDLGCSHLILREPPNYFYYT